MRVLWLSHFVPFPPKGGVAQRSFHLLKQMSQDCEISLVGFNRPRVSQEQLHHYKEELRKYCAAVEFWELPVAWKGLRWWAELALAPVFSDPHSCRAYDSRALAARWLALLQEHAGSIIHVDSSDLASFVGVATSHPVVLNHHNCESAMAIRRSQVEPNPLKKLYLADQARKQMRLEGEICHRVRVNTVVSGSDAELLRARNPRAHIHVVENGTDASYFRPEAAAVEPNSLVFAGSLDWYPNLSGIRFFAQRVWPTLKAQRPDARLYLAGKCPPTWLVAWSSRDPNVTLVDTPDDIRPWVARAAVFVCPIVDGGGTRLKILDAMAMGKAVVSTSIGCEGLRLTPGEHLLVADSPQCIASSVLGLLADGAQRLRLGAAARQWVEKEYDWRTVALRLRQAYQCASTGVCPDRTAQA